MGLLEIALFVIVAVWSLYIGGLALVAKERANDLEERVSTLESKPKPFADKVQCETCFCWLDKERAHRVSYGYGSFFLYYCGADKKPYTRVSGMALSGAPKYFADNIEVDEHGVPVKTTAKAKRLP